MTEESKTLGRKITELRHELNMQQDEFAEKLGVSRQALSQWETDKQIPRSDKILDICRIFSVSPEYFYGNGNSSKKKTPGIIVFLSFIMDIGGYIAGIIIALAVLVIAAVMFFVVISPNVNTTTVRVYNFDLIAIITAAVIFAVVVTVFLILGLVSHFKKKEEKK